MDFTGNAHDPLLGIKSNLSFSKLCIIARVLKKDAGSLARGLPED